MTKLELEIKNLITKYGSDVRRALSDNKKLDYVYALGEIRENLLEWYDFKGLKVLQVGADFGALTGLLLKKGAAVTVIDESADELEIVQMRHESPDLKVYQGNIKDFAGGEKFDAILFIGSLGISDEAYFELEAAKKLLTTEGKLIVAATNIAGIKYQAGTPIPENAMSLKSIKRLLPGAQIYYPVPDFRTPVEIFSDSYLPSKGSMSGMAPLYDWPETTQFDIAEAFERAIEEGKFVEKTNAYLIVYNCTTTSGTVADLAVEPKHPSSMVEYVRYNRTRRDEFQTKTSIMSFEGARYAEKTALFPEGRSHIESFGAKCEALNAQNPEIKAIQPEISSDGMTVRFPFLTGKTYADKLGDLVSGETAGTEGLSKRENLKKAIKEAMEKIFAEKSEAFDMAANTFSLTEEFSGIFDIFGKIGSDISLLEGEPCYAASNIDSLFENMVETDEGTKAIDYEWVFFCKIPKSFVHYRTLLYFFRHEQAMLPWHDEKDFMDEFPEYVPESKAVREVYKLMEESFQEYVHGENQRIYSTDYLVESDTAVALKDAKRKLAALRTEYKSCDVALKKEKETHRLTNNHVHNLEVIIGDLRRENGEMAKTLAYLNRHEAIIYKVKRKLGKLVNGAFPPGTVKRKKLSYVKNTILHPGTYMKLYTTAEGKNLIKGDFEIGEEYRQFGKLKFPYYEEPMVSVVIPVYNQIHYTYLCLKSILDYTQDVTYEIIIADDVSKDATEHLSEFVENVVISRNSVNQGFLRNCNQAAAKARGKYVMFLNNDTQVTENWLSSLVNLIESDDSIGMVGSKLVYPDGRLQEAGGIIWSDGSGWNYGRLDNPDKPEYNYVKDVDYISGAAILLSTKLWNEIGGFDDRFAPAYCEDSDLAFEVRRHGKRVVYQPLSKVIHFEGVSNGTDVNGTGLKRYQVENSIKLREKWADEFAKQCVNTGNPDPFRARERSMGKPVILVVDHYVPTFDRDAGSRTTYQYMKMFLAKGYVVKFLGDNFLHEEPYTTALEQLGIEVLYGAEYETGIWKWLEDHQDDIDVVYLNRPHIASKYVDYIADHTNCKMIYYGHDLHFLREFREYELTGNQEKKDASEYWKAIEFRLMHQVSMSYYPSYVEEEAIHEKDPSIKVKAITAYVYDKFLDKLNENFAEREGLLFVGGFAHPPNADAVLWFAKEVWPKIREKLNINFYVVGSKVTDEVKALEQPGNGIIIKGFVSDEELERLYRSCRIVVVPLRYGAGVKGKVVEAIYNGAPIITTSVGAEGIPEVEKVLMVEDDAERFAEAVVETYQDEKKLLELARGTQEYIRDNFSVDAAWKVIEKDFR